jgi:hypothetical protein
MKPTLNEKIDQVLEQLDQHGPEYRIDPEPASSHTDDTFSLDNMSGTGYALNWAALSTSQLAPLTITTNGSLGIGTSSSSSNWNYAYNTASSFSSKVHITGQGIDMDDDADIRFGNVSLRSFLERIEQRLAILVPDPKKLERYEALRQAYEHYKTLEALCVDEPETYD